MTDHDPERAWDRGWDEHSIAQQRRLARLPLSEKLRWLEETERLVRRMSEERRRLAEGKKEDAA